MIYIKECSGTAAFKNAILKNSVIYSQKDVISFVSPAVLGGFNFNFNFNFNFLELKIS